MYFSIFAPIIIFLCIIPASCVSFNVNGTPLGTTPKYNKVSSFVAPYVEQWIGLAADHDIYFKNTVNIGFTDLPEPSVGLTRYEAGFREIDIDSGYWNISSEIRKNILIWHELAHAYCERPHDYSGVGSYGDDAKKALERQKEGGAGFYPDHCPSSIMFPALLSDKCFKAHYFQYINEMFKRCIPY